MSETADSRRPASRVVMARLGRLDDTDREFDLEFWQAHTFSERMRAAWELVVHYHLRHGGSLDELRLRRSVARLRRRRR